MTGITAQAHAVPSRTAVRPGRSRFVVALLGAVLVLLCAVLLSLALGNKELTLEQIGAVLAGHGDPYLRTVLESRVPRTLIGVLAGTALASSGALLQAVTRNPLADPGLLGVNAGAALAIVLGTMLLGSAAATTIWVALPGALLAGVAVLLLGGGAQGRGNAGIVRLVLAGAVLAAVLTAIIQSITIRNPAVFDGYRFWVVGSLSGRGLDIVAQLAPLVLIGVLLALLLARPLGILALGADAASGLGVNTARVRIMAVLCATVLGAAATVAAGPIAFVGLAVPHIARALAGNTVSAVVGLSAVLGPSMLLLSDVIGRIIARPEELMVGVVTAFVGAPFLLIAVRRLRSAA